MNLFSYIDKYGCYSFEEVPFTEVDNAIFSALSYIDFEDIVSPNRFYKISIKNAGSEFFIKHPTKETNLLAIRQAIKMLKYIMNTRRYGNLYLYNYIYEKGDSSQFSAITIEINSKLVFVSFEGTDHLVSGWKEDFMLSYMFPVESQRRAIDYVNKRFFFRRKNIILGGHSKGGNLALVAGMYANFFVRDKIIKIYNNDGPGLLSEQFESKYYKNVESKLISIIPGTSFIGVMLKHNDNYKVVRTTKRGVWAHDLFTWVVTDKEFMSAELDSFSKAFSDSLIDWLNNYDREQRKKFVNSLFNIFDRANISNLIDIMENKRLIFELITKSKEMSNEDRKILKDFLGMLFKCFKDVKVDEIKSLFEKN